MGKLPADLKNKSESALDDLVPNLSDQKDRILYLHIILQRQLSRGAKIDMDAVRCAIHTAAYRKWQLEKKGAMIDSRRDLHERFEFLPNLKRLLMRARRELTKVDIPELSPSIQQIDALLSGELFKERPQAGQLRRGRRGRPISANWQADAHKMMKEAGLTGRETRDEIMRVVGLREWHDE